MTSAQLKALAKDRAFSLSEIAQDAGVPVKTLYEVVNGRTKRVSAQVSAKLRPAIERAEGRLRSYREENGDDE